MKVKKLITLGMASLLTASMLVVPVSAHGHHHHRYQSQNDTVIAVCHVDDCTIAGIHEHDGISYCGYDHEDGYCDGTCVRARRSASRSTGHHSHRHC